MYCDNNQLIKNVSATNYKRAQIMTMMPIVTNYTRIKMYYDELY